MMLLQPHALSSMAAAAAGLAWRDKPALQTLAQNPQSPSHARESHGADALINAEALVSTGPTGILSRKFLLLFVVASLVQPML